MNSLESAKRALHELYGANDEDRYFACDTEVVDIDLDVQGPVGHGRVISATIFAGPHLDYGNGPHLFIDNLDAAEGTLMHFKDFFEDVNVKKVCVCVCVCVCMCVLMVCVWICRFGITMVSIDMCCTITASIVWVLAVIQCTWLVSIWLVQAEDIL